MKVTNGKSSSKKLQPSVRGRTMNNMGMKNPQLTITPKLMADIKASPKGQLPTSLQVKPVPTVRHRKIPLDNLRKRPSIQTLVPKNRTVDIPKVKAVPKKADSLKYSRLI